MSGMIPAFNFHVGQQINQGQVVVGKFDGKTPSLACGTTGGKILIHSPHESSQGRDSALPPVRLLNFNKKITALSCGSLVPDSLGNMTPSSSNGDTLFVGTESNLLAYDVERNADVFYRDVQDGVNSLTVGRFTGNPKPLVFAGGNCSILGYDHEGSEAFWTVTGDNISSLTLCDIDGDGLQELLVGSDDFEIRVFRGEEVIHEISEAERITFLSPVQTKKFVYGLNNGTVGVYSGAKSRLWRVKTKNKATAVASFDLDKDGIPEVITGWANGAFQVRRLDNGDLLYKETLGSSVAGMAVADYRLDGKDSLMICSESGEVRGYLPTAEIEVASMADTGIKKAKAVDQQALEELQMKKLELTNELRLLSQRMAALKTTGEVPAGALPSGTDLSYSLIADDAACCVSLRVEASTDVQIANIVVIDTEGAVLEGSDILAVAPLSHGSTASVALRPAKNQPCTLRVQTHVCSRSVTSQLHVFESQVEIPKFASYKVIDESKVIIQPNSQVTLRIDETIERVFEWAKTAFILSPQLLKAPMGDKMKLCMVSVCKPSSKMQVPLIGSSRNAINTEEIQQPLHLIANKGTGDDGKPLLRVRIRCNDMELAAEVVQDMARYFKINELDAEADFPDDMAKFAEVVRQVEDYNEARVRLAADMADDSQRIKALIVRAEDSRLMVDMESMRRAYTELFSLNTQLMVGYNVRANNHAGLLASLKEVNQMIQRAANLRVGKAKSQIITDCRAAVKANDFSSLSRIIQHGVDSRKFTASNHSR